MKKWASRILAMALLLAALVACVQPAGDVTFQGEGTVTTIGYQVEGFLGFPGLYEGTPDGPIRFDGDVVPGRIGYVLDGRLTLADGREFVVRGQVIPVSPYWPWRNR